MLTYRKAIVGDIQEMARLRSIFLVEIGACGEDEREAFEAANLKYFEVALKDDSFAAWLAVDGDRIVGTSGLSFSVSPPSHRCLDGKQAYIMNIFTLPEYRKRGIGKELFWRIAGEAQNRGYKKITLIATDMGKPLYEQYGFEDAKGEMVFYG